MAEKKKSKLGAKAIFARILAVILVTAIGGVASFFGFKTYFSDKLKKDKKAEIAKQLKEESKERVVMTGGYTEQRPLSEQEQALFHQLMQGLTGVAYTPESVATQVVAGINYRFVCKARTVTLDPETYQAEVTVYQPLPGQGEARITSIKRL